MYGLTDLLEKLYQNASNSKAVNKLSIPDEIKTDIDIIVENSENFVGVVNVLITSLTYKIFEPNQDVRYHQAKLKDGYSGRTIDTKFIAPFLKSKGLKSAKEAGWLTRSLEQPYPYTKDYRGRIRNTDVKESFLDVLDYIEERDGNAEDTLTYMIASLIKQRDQNHIEIEKIEDIGLSINQIVELLDLHFEQSQSYGKSRLPVLAIHSIYQLLIPQLKRYESTVLQDLSSHTSADVRHGDIGDIQVNDSTGEPFEAIEVKYGIKITPSIVIDAYNKFKTTKVKRYYVLSTVNVDINELQELNSLIKKISDEHGCQVIVNGLLGTLKYYLRLIEDTTEFLNLYTEAVLSDKVIKSDHKRLWKKIINLYK